MSDSFRVSFFQSSIGPMVTVLRTRNGKDQARMYVKPSRASLGRLWRLVSANQFYRGLGRIIPWVTAPGWSWEWDEEFDKPEEEPATDEEGGS